MKSALTPLQQAYAIIWQDGTADLRAILAENPGLVASDGLALLITAAKRRRLDLVEILVAAGVDPNGIAADKTPLIAAADGGLVAIAAHLVERGAEVNKVGEGFSCTPLHQAAICGHRAMVEFLLDHGADPNILFGNPQKNAVAGARLFQKEEVAAFLESRGYTGITIKEPLVDVEAPEFRAAARSSSPGDWFERQWPHVYAYANAHGDDTLSERNRVFFLVGYLIDQISNGGVDQFYFNPSAEYAARVPSALDRIGATRVAELIRAINALIPGGPTPGIEELDLDEMSLSLPPAAEPLSAEIESIFAECRDGEAVLVRQLFDYYRA